MTTFLLIKTDEYAKWIETQTAREKMQIAGRLSKIELEGHFGVHRFLGEDVWELKWGNGRRVYYAYIPEKKILLLLGGNKNGQGKDVARAKKVCEKYCKA